AEPCGSVTLCSSVASVVNSSTTEITESTEKQLVVIRRLWRPLVWRSRHGWAVLIFVLGRTLSLVWTISLSGRASLLRPSALRRHLLTLLLLSAEPLFIVRPLCGRPLLLRNRRPRLRTRHILLRPLAFHAA